MSDLLKDESLPPTRYLLHTKLYRPRAADTWIARPRLLRALGEGLSRRLTLVDAPAGYGKTTLLAQWLSAHPLRSAWVSLDEGDNGLGMFIAYLSQAIRTVYPDSMPMTAMMLSAANLPALDQLVTTLINELDMLPDEIILVLDDFHLVRSPDIIQVVSRLIEHPPASLHLVLATRSDPMLPLARLRARGKLLELRASDLRFSPEEVRDFLGSEGWADLDEGDVRLLEARTEGWPAGLRLAALSLKDRPNPHGFIADFASAASTPVTAYLAHEVFMRLDARLQDVCMRTSVVDRFSAALCAALRAAPRGCGEAAVDDSDVLLKEIVRQNLFLIPLDGRGEWYRFHALFRDVLFEQLKSHMDAQAIAELHGCASDWFAAQGLPEEALQQARRANDMDRVVRLVEANVHPILDREEWMTLVRWLTFVPEQVAQHRPQLLIAQAYVKVMRDQSADILPLINRVEQLLEQDGDGAVELSAGERDALKGHVLALRAQSLYGVRSGAHGAELAEAALRMLPEAHRFARGMSLDNLAINLLAAGRQAEAEARLRHETARATTFDTFTLRTLHAQLAMACCTGTITRAGDLLERYLAGGESAGLMVRVCWAHAFMGMRYHELNMLDRAAEHLQVVMMYPRQASALCYTLTCLQLALTHHAAGRPDLADETLRELRAYARSEPAFARWGGIDATEARLCLLRGDRDGALRWVQSSEPEGDAGTLTFNELPDLTRAQILIAQGSAEALDEAMALLEALRRRAASWHYCLHENRVRAVQASALYAGGQIESALTCMNAAVAVGERHGWIRAFADLGADVLAVLRAYAATVPPGSLRRAYLDRVIAAFDAARSDIAAPTVHPAASPASLLTLREIEVLELLDKRRSDKEIAEALFVSRSTVAKHTASIYRKLGVGNRREAVVKARALGLLSAIR